MPLPVMTAKSAMLKFDICQMKNSFLLSIVPYNDWFCWCQQTNEHARWRGECSTLCPSQKLIHPSSHCIPGSCYKTDATEQTPDWERTDRVNLVEFIETISKNYLIEPTLVILLSPNTFNQIQRSKHGRRIEKRQNDCKGAVYTSWKEIGRRSCHPSWSR